MNFWVFGDSYMQFNENYINDIGKEINAKDYRIYGRGGSSLLYTYKNLLLMREQIEENDAVLIGLTSNSRWLFGENDDWHCMPTLLNKKEAYKYRMMIWQDSKVTNKTPQQITEELDSIPDEYYKAAEGYIKYLLSDKQSNLLAHSVISSIFHSIVPSLPTKRVAVVRTVSYKTDVDFNIPKDFYGNDPLHEIGKRYLIKNKGFDPEDDHAITSELNTHNHWIDEPEYKEYFFKEIDWVVKKLRCKLM